MRVFRDAAHLAAYRELAALRVCHAYVGLGEQATQGPALFVSVASTRGGNQEKPLRLNPGGQVRLYPLWVRRPVPVVTLIQSTSQAEFEALGAELCSFPLYYVPGFSRAQKLCFIS